MQYLQGFSILLGARMLFSLVPRGAPPLPPTANLGPLGGKNTVFLTFSLKNHCFLMCFCYFWLWRPQGGPLKTIVFLLFFVVQGSFFAVFRSILAFLAARGLHRGCLGHPGTSWGFSGGTAGRSGAPLGTPGHPLGRPWDRPGHPWGPFWCLLDFSKLALSLTRLIEPPLL